MRLVHHQSCKQGTGFEKSFKIQSNKHQRKNSNKTLTWPTRDERTQRRPGSESDTSRASGLDL